MVVARVAAVAKPPDRWRNAKRRVMRKLADRRTRRHVLLVLVTLLAIGSLAAVKGLIGYYVFSAGATRFEVGLVIVAIIAAVFALGERKVATALEARFNRNTRKHREALAALRDELAEIAEPAKLEHHLVARFDELFATNGTVLYIDDGTSYAVAASSAINPLPLPYEDPLVAVMREHHAAVVPAERGSQSAAPLAWPLRSRGHLIGILAAGEHDYLESFDATEIEAVEAVADAAAANLALLDSSLTANLVHTPNNLPPALATFIGRTRELAECRELLAQGRLLTLTGFGGAGKTSLARRLADEALGSHRGGVWWVELAGVADDAHVAAALAAAMSIEETQDTSHGAADLAGRIGNEGVLIVLDTCEHVRRGCAALADELLRHCQRLSLLATSQSPLGVAGERDYALPPLDMPDGEDAAELSHCDAVRLFVERAQAAAPGFSPDASDMDDIVAIVRQLDGIPLAIELAAARLRLLSLAAIREHLAESLRLLAGGEHAEARHETMRASLAWSYDPLAEGEQRLLRRLSVFLHGFTLDAAARVAADAGDALDILDPIGRLVEASLVMVARHGGREPRYHMPETLRQFLAERLALDADAAEIRERHARYYIDLAARESPALHGRDAARALERLDQESANFAAAHNWCMRAPEAGAAVLSLGHSLAPYFRDRGRLSRGKAQLREALSHAKANPPHAMRAAVLLDLAQIEQASGDHTSALAHLAEAETGTEGALAPRVDGRYALSLQATGDAMLARRKLDDALASARKRADTAILQQVLDDAAEFFVVAGAWSDAAAMSDESLALARASDDVEALHLALHDAARVAVGQRDLQRARALLREAIDLALASNAQIDGEHDLQTAIAVATAEADWTRVARYAGAAEAETMRLGNGTVANADSDAARQALGAVPYAVAYEAGHRQKLAQALAEIQSWLAETR